MPLIALGLGWLLDILHELALWSGVLLLVASGLSLYYGWNRRRAATLVEETPRTGVTDIRSPGIVRVRGTVVPEHELDTFTSPIAADEGCVLSAWEIEEKYDTAKNRTWEPAAWGIRTVPFYIDDGTDRILVDVENRTVGNETGDVFTPEKILVSDGVSLSGVQCSFDAFDIHVETDYGESPPERITAFLEATDGASVEPMAPDIVVDQSKRKYHEATLQPGDEVSVMGHAESRHDAPMSTTGPENLVLSQSDTATFRLSTAPFDELTNGVGGLLFALFTGIVGAALLAAVFAP
ncbi:MAG: hypothetical protein ACI8UR_001763 [Natronomonas sp.]|jgi:hypothetical protein|uniref:hypothetical protein n=1 Tax=Natronomonas sp. TaxID=2184060 RepID=UPI003989AB12